MRVALSARGRLVLALLVTGVTLGSAGCLGALAGEEPRERAPVVDGIPPSVEVFTDHERGVVCYVYESGGYQERAGGLSCVPLNDTTLGGGR